MTLSKNLQRLMGDLGVSATALATAVGVNKATVSRWVHGEATPRARLLPQIARTLHCEIADLTGEAPKPPIDPCQATYTVQAAAEVTGLSVTAMWALLKSDRAQPWGTAWQMPGGKWKALIFSKLLNERLGIAPPQKGTHP